MIADLTDRVAFVAGAGSGIGRATIACLVEQWHTVPQAPSRLG
jgi:NAD(P)-dependent dehydrogenase (short-subunit alcohol dehydrogenase family)